ncbi:hypothetical protein PSCICF_24390 [Pseudomonas cichorii]|nr:hypothetical protein PSCICF_24390 [Pseudomonas cichorii]GFM61133.1 hypothetical protein PSCICG_22930 [Pseudomonas cichorii]
MESLWCRGLSAVFLRWAQGYHAHLHNAGAADTSCIVTEGFRAPRDADALYRLPAPPFDNGRHFIKKDFYMKNKRARDSGNGRFITVDEARRRPKETTVETIRKPSPRKKES